MNIKKAQSALEYLMTYGWAILIIVIVGGALYALNVFTPTTTKVCSGFGTLIYKDHSLLANGNMTIAVAASAVGGQIQVTSISVGGGTPASAGDILLTSTPAVFSVVNSALAKPVGTQYSGITVTLNYKSIETGIAHADSATCMGQYE